MTKNRETHGRTVRVGRSGSTGLKKDSKSKFYGFSFVFCKNSLVPLFLLTLKNINSKHYWLKSMVV